MEGRSIGTGGMEGRSMGLRQDGWRGVAWDRRDGGA